MFFIGMFIGFVLAGIGFVMYTTFKPKPKTQKSMTDEEIEVERQKNDKTGPYTEYCACQHKVMAHSAICWVGGCHCGKGQNAARRAGRKYTARNTELELAALALKAEKAAQAAAAMKRLDDERRARKATPQDAPVWKESLTPKDPKVFRPWRSQSAF